MSVELAFSLIGAVMGLGIGLASWYGMVRLRNEAEPDMVRVKAFVRSAPKDQLSNIRIKAR